MKKIIILFALILTGCVEAKEEIVCNPTIEYVTVIEYVDNIIIETEYIEKLVKVPYETIKEVIVEVPVEVVVYETITKTKWKTEYIETIKEVEKIVYVEKNKIAFVGDSITMLFEHPTVEGTTIFNFGYSGKTTSYILNKLDTILEYDLDSIYLMIGINDIKAGVNNDEVLSNYSNIISKIKTEKPNVNIYIQSILPASEYRTTVDFEELDNINQYISNIAFTNSGVTYIDLHSLYADENGYMKDEYTTDGVHLTELGYSVWINELSKYGF